MLLNINHTTRYTYSTPATYALLQLRVCPQTTQNQKIHSWDVALEGARRHATFIDQHGNLVDLLELDPKASTVIITVNGRIETQNTSGVIGKHTLSMPTWFYLRQTDLTRFGPLNEMLLDHLAIATDQGLDGLHRLSAIVLENVAYTHGETNTLTTSEMALAAKQGVCQDHTHIFLSAARKLGFPARYVSGYLMLNDRTDQDASHAWAEAYVEGIGWVGFDVSNGISPDERYVQTAYGLDYHDAAPTSGIVLGAQGENMVVSIQVQQ